MLRFGLKDNKHKEAGLKKLAAELKQREELDVEVQNLKAKIKLVRL